MLLHISSHPCHGHSVPVLQVGDQHAEGQGDLSLVRVEAAKQGAKLLSHPSAQGALALIAPLLPNCVLLQCSFVLFLGLALFLEAQWTEGTRAVGLRFSLWTTLQRRNGNPDCTQPQAVISDLPQPKLRLCLTLVVIFCGLNS